MKASLIVSLALTVAALVIGTPASAQSVGTDSVVGSASDCLHIAFGQTFCDRGFYIEAGVESGPGGEHPAGPVHWHDGGPTPGASSAGTTQATCLSVSGHTAIIGVSGTWERFGVSGAVFPVAGLVRVVDAGGPDSGADTIQLAMQTGAEDGPPLPGPANCSSFPGPFPTGAYPFPDSTNETGDLVVVDTRQSLAQARKACIFALVAHGAKAFRAKYGLGPHHILAMWACVHRRTGF